MELYECFYLFFTKGTRNGWRDLPKYVRCLFIWIEGCVLFGLSNGRFVLNMWALFFLRQRLPSGSVGGHAAHMPWSLWFCLLFSIEMHDHKERSIFTALFFLTKLRWGLEWERLWAHYCPESSVGGWISVYVYLLMWMFAFGWPFKFVYQWRKALGVDYYVAPLLEMLFSTVLQLITPLTLLEDLCN